MNEGYRYADWLITVPLLVIELLIVLGVAADQRKATHEDARPGDGADDRARLPG